MIQAIAFIWCLSVFEILWEPSAYFGPMSAMGVICYALIVAITCTWLYFAVRGFPLD